MAIKRQANLLQQQRLDIPHLRAIESAVSNDFDALLRGWVTRVGFPYFIRGFRITYAVGGLAEALYVEVADSAIFHSTATESGTVLTVPAGTAAEILGPTNSKVTGSFIAAATNFVALDYTRAPDSTTNDLVKFINPDTKVEFAKTVPLAQSLNYQFVISPAGFGTLLPIAKVVTDASNRVVSITDCRPMLMRLGSGGVVPDPTHVYPWPAGPDVPGSGRLENPSTSSTPGIVNTPFEGGDKEIQSLKDWLDAAMSRIRELDGGTYWYSPSIASLTGLAQNQNVHILDSGVVWNWNLATQVLSWSGSLTFQVPGAVANNTLAAGNVTIIAGQCAYVTIDRTVVVPTPVPFINVVDDDAVPVDEDNFVFARRDGNDIIVGTHSFRVKPTDATESDYSDHLSKEKLLKPIVTQAGANTGFAIYPSQRVSGNKRRYIYIQPKESSLFPRTGYLAGTYDGGANNDQLTTIDFVNNAGTLEVHATLPSIVPPILASDAIATWTSKFTPVLIAVSTADALTVTFGNHYGSLAAAIADAAMPVPGNPDYPVAVAIIEVNGAGVIQPIVENHLIDRRPTGAGGSGSGGGSGSVTEYTAVGGETLILLPLGQTYTPGLGDLAVIENGVELFADLPGPIFRDYAETDGTHITLHIPAGVGDRYKFRTGAGVTPGTIGDVVGPAAATDNAIVRFDLATGKLIQNSLVLLDDFGSLTGILDLTMTGTLTGGASPFIIKTVEANGAGAIGFKLDTTNTLNTNGSKILSVRNNTVEHLVIRRGTDYGLNADYALVELFGKTGALSLQLSCDATGGSRVYPQGTFTIDQLTDPTYGAGYKENLVSISNASNPSIVASSELDSVGKVDLEMSGGNVGGGPGTYPSFFVDVIDQATAEGTAELGLFTEDNTACNRTDVRFNAVTKYGYLGIASTGAFFGGSALVNPASWLFESGAIDGATVIAYDLDTFNTLANAAAKLLRLSNNGVPKFVLDKDGNITTVGTIAGFSPNSLYALKGDVLIGTAVPGTPAILSVGANPNGFVLALDNATATGLKWSSAGAGDVIGPGLSTNNALVTWNGISGTNVNNSLTTLDALGIMTHGGAVNFKRKTNADLAIALANALKAMMNAHAADGAEHFAGGGPTPDIVNFPVVVANATDLTTLYPLCLALFTAYAAHNVDAINAGPTYHNAQSLPGNALVSALIPTSLDEAVARLNDLKAKYNLHDADVINHTTGGLHQEAVVDSSGDYTTNNETVVAMVDTTSIRAVTLSDTDKQLGRLVVIKDESGNATAMPITVTPQTGTVDGAPNVSITADYGSLRLYSDGSDWFSM